jgi:hypothetical protein
MEKKLIDDCFYIQQKKYGLWYSTDLEETELVTSLTEEQCVSATRYVLKGRQEGFPEPQKVHEGIVGGKL